MFVCWALNRRHFIKTYVCDTRTCDRIMPSLLTVISRYTSSVTLSNATLETKPAIEYNFSQHDLYVEQNRSHQCGCFVWVRHHITRVIEMWMIPAAAHIHRQVRSIATQCTVRLPFIKNGYFLRGWSVLS